MQPTAQAQEGETLAPCENLLVWQLERHRLEVRAPGNGSLARQLWEPDDAPRSLSALLGRLCVPGQVVRLGNLIEQVAADGLPRSVRHTARRVDGRELKLETRALLLAGEGDLVCTTGLAPGFDDANWRLKALFEAQPLTLLEFDAKGELVHSEGRLAPWASGPDRPPWLDADLPRARAQGKLAGGGAVDGRSFHVQYRAGLIAERPDAVLAIALEVDAASDELRSTVHDLYAVLDAIADGISLQAPSGSVMFMNRAGLQSLGLKSLNDLAHFAEPDRVAEDFQSRHEDGTPYAAGDLPGFAALEGRSAPIQLTRFRVPGASEDSWSIFRALPLFDATGSVRLAVNVWTDVTEIQRAREELRRERALLAASSEASLDAALIVSPERRWLYYNQRFRDLWGLSREVLESGDDHQAIHSVVDKLANPEGFHRRVAEIYATPDAVSRDVIPLVDGRVIERYSAPARGENGEHYGRVWFFRDITDRSQTEERERALRESQGAQAAAEAARISWEFIAEVSRSLGGLLDVESLVARVVSLSVPRLAEVCVIDLASGDGTLRRAGVAHANPAMAELAAQLKREPVDPAAPLGVAEVIRSSVAELVSLRPASEAASPSWSPLGERGPRAGELLAQLGVNAWLCVPLVARGRQLGAVTFGWKHAPPLADQFVAGELAQRAAMAIESALLYQRAQQAVALRDDFLSVASHEFRTPVTALRLAQQALLRQSKVDAPSSEASVKLVRAVGRHERRLSKLVDMLLDVTRIHGAKLSLDLEQVDLSTVALDAGALFAGEAERSGSALTVHAPTPVIGRWDQARLEQVAANLLANALKYGAGHPVEVEVTRRDRQAFLVVRDHGIGIPLESQSMIFERFERAVSSKHYGGLGLGLYIVRGIAQALGGKVSLQSAPDEGSTFTVELPCDGPPGAP